MGRQAGSNPPMDDGDKCTFNPKGEIDEVEGDAVLCAAAKIWVAKAVAEMEFCQSGNVNLTMTMIVGTGDEIDS